MIPSPILNIFPDPRPIPDASFLPAIICGQKFKMADRRGCMSDFFIHKSYRAGRNDTSGIGLGSGNIFGIGLGIVIYFEKQVSKFYC